MILIVFILCLSFHLPNVECFLTSPSKVSQSRINVISDYDRSSTSSLTIGVRSFQIVSKEEADDAFALRGTDSSNIIRLSDVSSGWGNAAHPTTRLCMEFLIDHVKAGDNVLDYGTGSGILSILAAKLGAIKCVAVDIDEDTIKAAQMNAILNNVESILDVVHTKQVYVGEDRFPICDITVANILPVRSITFMSLYFMQQIMHTYVGCI